MKKVWIYGLFNRLGNAVYIGQSAKPDRRFKAHCAQRFPGARLRILRTALELNASRFEAAEIRRFKRLGQAKGNKKIKQGSPHREWENNVQIKFDAPKKIVDKFISYQKEFGASLNRMLNLALKRFAERDLVKLTKELRDKHIH